MKKFIQEQLRKSLLQENDGPVTLYHRIGNKGAMPYPELIGSVIQKGLIPHDNGEVGSTIWFSDSYNDYAKNANFVVSIEFNQQNKDNFDLYYSNHNGFAYKAIPFEALDVVKIPVAITQVGHPVDNQEMIEMITKPFGKTVYTPEVFNKNTVKFIVYRDIFNKYVQPFIDVDNYVDQLDSPYITIIDVLK